MRKIIHIDMDAFFASVEQRDHPELRGKPIAVGYDGARGVVSTASYEARKFGVHSAMSVQMAKRLCKDLIIVEGSYQHYKEVSAQIHRIFHTTQNSLNLYPLTRLSLMLPQTRKAFHSL